MHALKFTLVRTCLRLFSGRASGCCTGAGSGGVSRPASTGSIISSASGGGVSGGTGSPLASLVACFQIAVLNHLPGLAAAALEQHAAGFFFGVRHAGEFDAPEV